jgi:SAM-dependent methyltransferase
MTSVTTHRNVESFESDRALERLSNYSLVPVERELFSKYYRPSQHVLDLACGAGRTTLRLHEMGVVVKGVDLSAYLIAMARQRFPYLDLQVADYCELKEPKESFDHILISFNGLDYTHPEFNRELAIQNCFQIVRRGGTFIFSSHNLKALYFSPYYLHWNDLKFKLRNTLAARGEKAYLFNKGNCVLVFHASPSYVIRQTEAAGFEFVEMVGFRRSRNRLFNTYCSVWNHYVFRRP